MTAKTKNIPPSKTVKVRGKRIGPSNVEAKRAAALRQAASAAETERQATGVASTVSFFAFLREAVVTGVIPGNAELLSTIDTWASSPALRAEGLSPTGQRLVRDFKDLLSIFGRFLRERNSDELLQRFLHHVHLAGRVAGVDLAIAGWRARGKQRRLNGALSAGGRGKISLWRSATKKKELFIGGEHSKIAGIDVSRRQEGRSSSQREVHPETERPEEHMKRGIVKDAKALLRIAQMLITSTDFRAVLQRIQTLARKINDNARARDQVVEPEETYEYSEAEEEEGFEEEAEPLQQQQQPTSRSIDSELADLEKQVEGTTSELYSTARQGALSQQREDSSPHEQQRQQPLQYERTEQDIPIPPFSAVPELPIVSEAKQPVLQEKQPLKRKARAKPATAAEHEEILQEMKDIFGLLAGNKAFSRAIRDFYFVVLRLRAKIDVGPDVEKMVEADLRYDANFRAAQDELIQLMERLAGGASLSPVIENLKKVRDEVRTDYELRDFFGDWRAFLKRCTGPDGVRYLESEEYQKRGSFLLNRTENYLRPSGAYRSHMDEAYEALDAFTDGLRSDKLTRQLGNQLTKLVKEDLIGAARGERVSLRTLLSTSTLLRPDLLNDIRFFLLPRIIKSMQSIPLPRIEIVSGGTVLVLEDVIVPADALVPMQLELITSSHVTMNPKSRLFRKTSIAAPDPRHRVEGVQGGVHLKLSSIAGQVRNVRFTLDRREGWPQFSDQGLADLRIGGKGLMVLIDLISHPASEVSGRRDLRSSILPAALVAHRVKVRIDKLSLHLHDSLHDGMYRVFNPLIGSIVKRQIESSIRDQIVNVVDAVDGLLDRLSRSVVNQ